MKNSFNKVLLGLALAMMAGVFAFFYHLYQRDMKTLADFLDAYQKFDQTVSDWSIPVLATHTGDTAIHDQLNKIYTQIKSSAQDASPNSKRLAWAKEAILLNAILLDHLKKNDTLEGKAFDALADIKVKAAPLSKISSLIKNEKVIPQIGEEIVGYSQGMLDNLRVYTRIIRNERDRTNQLLQTVVKENGGLTGFINGLSQGNDQTEIQDQNVELDSLSRKFTELDNSRKSSFESFKRLGE